LIVGAKVIRVQDLKYSFATFTTKGFGFEPGSVLARLATIESDYSVGQSVVVIDTRNDLE